MPSVVNIERRRMEKILVKEMEKIGEQKCEDVVLFKKIIEKNTNNLQDDEHDCYDEIVSLGSFLYNDNHIMYIVRFRQIVYVIHDLTDGTFEYIGTMEEVLSNYLK